MAIEHVSGLEKTFMTRDPTSQRSLISPRGTCPVLFGVRGTSQEAAEMAAALLLEAKATEPIISMRVFQTNQASDDHLDSILSSTVKGIEVLRRGTTKIETEAGDWMAFAESGDVKLMAQSLQPGDQIDVALAQQPHPGGQREIAATALAGDHDAVRIDAERLGVGVDPPNRRNTIVQTGRELADLPRRRRHDRIAEVDGDDDRSLTGHHPVKGSVVAVERRQIRHAATMEIDHPRRRRRPPRRRCRRR